MKYDPKNVADYEAQIDRGKTVKELAGELGIKPATLFSVLRRHQERKKIKKASKVKVVDLSQSVEKKEKSIPELLSGIDINVTAIKKILGI
jgi:transposase-like protein